MYRITITLLLLILVQCAKGQATSKEVGFSIPDNLTYSTSSLSSYIKDHFTSDSERVHAIFLWVANNISYDIERFQKKTTGQQPVPEVLKTRLAVCMGYAELFSELCSQCGIPSLVIGGYTKLRGTVSNISHAWVAVALDHKWWFFDPTWAAGYVRDNTFTKGYTNTYYKVSPELMIKDHMPFDPLYQLLDHPLTNKDFIEGSISNNRGKTIFNYADSLEGAKLLSKETRIKNELKRVLNNGIENDVIKQYYDLLLKQVEGFSSKNSFEQAISLYNHSITLFNEYIFYKNKLFESVNDKDLKLIVDSISSQVNEAYNMLGTAIPRDETNRQALAKAYQELERFHARVSQEKEFVSTYLHTDANARKKLFYKK